MQITKPSFDEKEIENLRECLASGWVTQGPMTEKFESQMSKYHQVVHSLATTSCSAALHLAALALRLGPGDEVIVPAFTWITSANCAEYVGAQAVFADIDPDTYNIDPVAFEAAITERTRAVVVVHLFGLAANMDAVMEIAERHNIFVIEDAACAIGVTYKGRPVGGLGTVGCFSFHPRKVITTGEGGMVVTNDDIIADRLRSLRNHGATGVPELERGTPWSMSTFDELGFNLRLSDIQAAVGVAQMDKLDALLAERRNAALRYNELLDGVDELVLPIAGDVNGHTYQSYVIRVLKGGRAKRNAIMQSLADSGIQSRPGTHAVHNLGWYQDKYGFTRESFPVASNAEDTTITLPIFPGMVDHDLERVTSIILKTL